MHPCLGLPPALRVSTRASILLAMYQGPCAQIVLVLLLPIACAAPGRLEPFAYLLLVRRRNPKRSGLHACLPRVAFTRCPCLPCVMQRPGLRHY